MAFEKMAYESTVILFAEYALICIKRAGGRSVGAFRRSYLGKLYYTGRRKWPFNASFNSMAMTRALYGGGF
jgi:hypothetical protein